MLKSVSQMRHLAIHASDGEIGHVEEFYFDDETWAVRYLIVNTGSWLLGRLVLISPAYLRQTDWDARQLHLALTKKQIEDSPDIDTQKPVSRQHEAEYLNYYGSSYYWGGSYLWGMGPMPSAIMQTPFPIEFKNEAAQLASADSHLHSTAAVSGYSVAAADGEVGHVKDFIVSPDTWKIRYLEVDTGNWLPGKKVLISPAWIPSVSWNNSNVATHLSRQMIQSAPEYSEGSAITREYENDIYVHYNQPPYWSHESEGVIQQQASLS